jgi:hypothetical protein
MKRYVLNIVQPDEEPPPPEVLDPIMRELDAWNAEAKAAGAWVFDAALFPPSSSTVVRAKDGDVLTTDGPFAEGKEYVGGFTIIQAEDLDGALDWANKLARILEPLSIEVRPAY